MDRKGSRATVFIKSCLSAAILACLLFQTSEMLEEEWKDPKPGGNLAFGAFGANRAAETLGVRNWA